MENAELIDTRALAFPSGSSPSFKCRHGRSWKGSPGSSNLLRAAVCICKHSRHSFKVTQPTHTQTHKGSLHQPGGPLARTYQVSAAGLCTWSLTLCGTQICCVTAWNKSHYQTRLIWFSMHIDMDPFASAQREKSHGN